ncbi:MAG: hypothetical protein ACPGOY_07070 [Rhodospirillaceae bacterium]
MSDLFTLCASLRFIRDAAALYAEAGRAVPPEALSEISDALTDALEAAEATEAALKDAHAALLSLNSGPPKLSVIEGGLSNDN